MNDEELLALRATLLDAMADCGLTVYDGEHDRWIGPYANRLIEIIDNFQRNTVGIGGILPETRAKLDDRRRAHGWTWDEYLEIIGSLEEAFDEP